MTSKIDPQRLLMSHTPGLYPRAVTAAAPPSAMGAVATTPEGPALDTSPAIIRAKAPLRISFGGGGTDVSPYYEERGGVVLSMTIDKYAYATIMPRDDERIVIRSIDFDSTVELTTGEEPLYDGNLDLVKAAIKRLGTRSGFSLLLHCDVPPGSGLGSSATMTTALIGVLRHWFRCNLTDYQVAELAYQVERVELGIKGGKQDQYASVFGGLNLIEFYADRTVVNPLRLKPTILNELEYRTVLCYTGRSRVSGEIIEDQVARYTQKTGDIVEALDRTKALAYAMKDALLLGELDEFGHLLHEAWEAKRRFSPKIAPPYIDEMYETALRHGAVGGKLLGAGGGGHILFLCAHNRRLDVVEALTKAGGTVTPFAFEFVGLQTWEVDQW